MQQVAQSSPIKRALVVEGGGMRGIFTAGILDAFLDKRLSAFDGYYGVSSGALNLSSFIAGQRGRNLDIYTNLCLESEFISLLRHIRGGDLFDLDWFFQKLSQQNALNFPRFKKKLNQQSFTVVSTCIDTGKPVYHSIDSNTPNEVINDALKASSALPMIYRKPVFVNNQALTDGSLSDPLPIQKAIDDGHNQIIVLRTRQASFRKHSATGSRIYAWKNRQMPAVSMLIKEQNTIYNQAADFAESVAQDKSVQLVHISPLKPLNTSRGTRHRNHLFSDYHSGYTLGYSLAEQLT
ncbi:patatin family protein [Endozoicomonas sp. SESOKO1]|uniref:patatin-like phospholipase family protein n=1 Tax=Endozoicomonas sp. SESOKO1 TaxID=2828742 RepID=UPI002147AA3E|nr:patatin family protein [Endozoicomonas sp. SESOKO1]